MDLLADNHPSNEKTRKRKIHKQKLPTKVKVANLCCDWPFKNSLGPLMFLLYGRVKKGLAPKTAFEKEMYPVFEKFSPDQNAAIEVALKAYQKLPEARRCVFEDRFDEWPDDLPLDTKFIDEVITQEVVQAGRYGIFGHQHPGPTVGFTRPWEQTFGTELEGQETKTLKGPWPWICAVNPGADNINWYKNTDYVYPDKSDINKVAFGLHEFDVKCTASAPDPANPTQIVVNCEDKISSGSGAFNFVGCDGGSKFDYRDPFKGGQFRCLKVPPCVAGQGVALRGFNFTSLDCYVVLKKAGGGAPDIVIPDVDVMGDDDAAGMIASCAVQDKLTFTIPRRVRDGLNESPVVPGQYLVEVHVPNDSHYAPDGGVAPKEFVSNRALVDVLPPTDIPYQVWFDRGNCYKETRGAGSDEAWFSAFTAIFRGNQNDRLETTSQTIFREDELDSGDWIGFQPVSAFSGKLGPQGLAAIAVVGVEVDSEQAAKDQVTAYWSAYGLYAQQLLTVVAAGGSLAVFGKGLAVLLDTGAITASLVVGGVALLIIAGIGLIWAAWAPADPLAYDLILFDQVGLYQITTPGQAERVAAGGHINGVDWKSYPKGSTPKGIFTAEYREERQFWCRDVGSHYGLEFYVNQTAV